MVSNERAFSGESIDTIYVGVSMVRLRVRQNFSPKKTNFFRTVSKVSKRAKSGIKRLAVKFCVEWYQYYICTDSASNSKKSRKFENDPKIPYMTDS
jgi:hypothetical protein